MLFRCERRIPTWKRAAIMVAIGLAVAVASLQVVEAKLGGLSEPSATPRPSPDPAAAPAAPDPDPELLALALETSAFAAGLSEAPDASADAAPPPESLDPPARLSDRAGSETLAVPEPSTAPLLGAGLIVLLLLSRRLGAAAPAARLASPPQEPRVPSGKRMS